MSGNRHWSRRTFVGALAATGITPIARPALAQGVKVKIGTSAGINAAIQPVLYAQTAKLYAKHGLDVEFVNMNDDTTAVQGLIAGACDMLYAGAGTGMIATSRGADIRIVMSHTPWTDYVFVAQKEINSLKDLVGKPIGISRLGSLNHQASTFALRHQGVDPASVQFLAIAGSDAVRAQALVARSIAATVMNGTFATQALQSDASLKIVFDVGAVFRDKFLSTAFFARGNVIKDKPDAVQGAVKALIESCRALMSDKALAIDHAVQSGLKREVMTPVYDNIFKASTPYYGVDGGIDKARIESTVAILRSSNDMEKDMAFEQLVDLRFVTKAIADLGPFKK